MAAVTGCQKEINNSKKANQTLALMDLCDIEENNLKFKFYNPEESEKSETQQTLKLAFNKIKTKCSKIF